MRLGWPEMILILLVVMIVFGVGKLPQVGSQLGKGIREFRKAAKGDLDEPESDSKTVKSSPEQLASK
jgi:sec-independent protein translocase protein TatA